jgi:hypothetical protein
MRTEASLDQSRRFAAEMAHWLERFDETLADCETPVRDRPLQALLMLFEHEAIEMDVGHAAAPTVQTRRSVTRSRAGTSSA